MAVKKDLAKTNHQESTKPKARTTKPHFSQSDFPQRTLQEAQKIASCLMDSYAGDKATPPDVALGINISPTSENWKILSGSSIAYGLTEGGPNADFISLTTLGKKLVAPEQEGEDVEARRAAILCPKMMKQFFEKYQRNKFPNEVIGMNVLRSLGVPPERLKNAYQIVLENGKYAGIIRESPTGLFVSLDAPSLPGPSVTSATENTDEENEEFIESSIPKVPKESENNDLPSTIKTSRVFISHGKQREIASQIKELLAFGQFEPVISVERESTAIPVPEKVFEDMRSCSAGVIHVSTESEVIDKDGNKVKKINENVLIEIGAAMALYGKRIVILVEKGLNLPSNLQGLYRCEYEGDKLDYDSTMKLLKTFSQFR
jgi:predicted nucleotide-binding protein